MNQLRRILVGAVTVPAFLLSACGGGNDSVADPPISSAPTSLSPTQAAQHEALSAFIKRWVEQDTRMQNTGVTDEFRRMSRGCEGCDSVANKIDGIYEAGGDVRTQGWSLLRFAESARDGHERTIELFVDSAPTSYTPGRDAATRHLDGGREHFQIQVIPARNSWLVTEFVQVAS